MATKLTKPVARETDVHIGNRVLIAALTPKGLLLREKGRRKGFLLPYKYGYVIGARLEADAARAAKPTRRRASRSLLRGR